MKPCLLSYVLSYIESTYDMFFLHIKQVCVISVTERFWILEAEKVCTILSKWWEYAINNYIKPTKLPIEINACP